MSTYTPKKGKIIPFLNAVLEDRTRTFTITEAARLMQVSPRGVMAMVSYAIEAGVVFRGKDPDGLTVLRGTPFANVDPHAHPRRVTPQSRRRKEKVWTPRQDDIRIPRVVEGWRPPQMVAPRGGA